jgi:large subunit ribosomal protein L9
MRIVLRDDVERVGKKGDVVEVADGYARNFLMPRGLAVQAGKGALKQAEAMRRARETRETREREGAEGLMAKLNSAPIRIIAKAGEGGKLFGSVTAADIAEAAATQAGVELDRRKLDLPEPIRELGTHQVSLKLHPEVDSTFSVLVLAE